MVRVSTWKPCTGEEGGRTSGGQAPSLIYTWSLRKLTLPKQGGTSGGAAGPDRQLHGEEFCLTRSLRVRENEREKTRWQEIEKTV